MVTHTLREKADLEEEVRELKERLASQQLRGSVIQDLQDRLKMVKDMNQRLDQDNEELRLRLQSAQHSLQTNHEHNTANSVRRAPKTAGSKAMGSTMSFTTRFPQAGKKNDNQMSKSSMTRILRVSH